MASAGPRGIAAQSGYRKPFDDKEMYLRIWTDGSGSLVENRGTESEVLAEFHRLKAEGRVSALEMGAMERGSRQGGRSGKEVHSAWISWKNTHGRPACPHCGGKL